MKKYFLILFLSISVFASAQKTLNDYKYVIVPVKYSFLKEENKYRLNTITKFNLQKMGFEAFYENENLPVGAATDRCQNLYVNVDDDGGLLTTKLIVTFRDCQNNVVHTSLVGKSKSKEYKIAFPEALNDAFVSLFNFGYSYNGGKNLPEVVNVQKTETPKSSPQIEESQDYLFAQPIPNGYQLVDKTPKVVLKIYKTSQPDYFTAQSETKNGAVIKKNGEWILEYYKDDKPVSEKLLIKF
ncbi:hypothetical protein D3C80_1417150 [compost metagenome]